MHSTQTRAKIGDALRLRIGFDHRPSPMSYSTVHRYVRKLYPKEGRCEWCGCTGVKTEYAAARPGFYTVNRADWLELCVPHHLAFDGRRPPVVTKAASEKIAATLRAKGRTTTTLTSSDADRGRHVRWHVNRGVVHPECALCNKQTGVVIV